MLAKILLVAGIAGALILLPVFLDSPYLLHLVIMTCIGSILAMGFSMIYSMGRVGMGAGAFYAIGAYASATLAMKFGLSFWQALPLSTLITFFFALALGSAVVRSSGMGFGITTLIIGMAVTQLIGASPYLGGWGGLVGIPPPTPIELPFLPRIEFVGKVPYYYLVLLLLLITMLCFWALYSSRIGRNWRAIKLSPHLAETLGINLFRYRLLAFVVASTSGGAAGSFYVHYSRLIEPTAIGGFFSVYIQMYSFLGGLNYYLLGPVIGAAIMTFLPESLRVASEIEPIITGVLLMIIILLSPGGILGLVAKGSKSLDWANRVRIRRSKQTPAIQAGEVK